MTNQDEVFKQILREILQSDYAHDFVSDVLSEVKEGKKVFDDMLTGFGPQCYYKSHRDLVEDVVHGFFENEVEHESPTLSQLLLASIRDEVSDAVSNWENIRDAMRSSLGSTVVVATANYSHILGYYQRYVLAQSITDAEVEELIQECSKNV